MHTVRVVALVLAGIMILGALPSDGLGSERPGSFERDPILAQALRPSTLPIGLEDPTSFHRKLVHIVDGGLALSFMDVFLPGGQEPLAIKRQYRSGLRAAGVFGSGWVSNLDVHLATEPGGTPRVVEENGQVTGYEPQGDRYVPVAGAFPGNVLYRSRDKWVRESADGLTEVFDGFGRLEERSGTGPNPRGEAPSAGPAQPTAPKKGAGPAARVAAQGPEPDKVTFTYADPASRLPSAITDGAGHVARLSYQDGLLVRVDFPSGRNVRYEYKQQLLAGATDPIGRKTSFVYEHGRMSEMGLPGGQAVRFAYASDGTLQEVLGPGALRTSFAWQIDPDRGGVRLTAAAPSGASHTVEIAAAAIDPAEWGLKEPKQLGLELRHAQADGGMSSSFILKDKVLMKTGSGRAVLDPAAGHPRSANAGRLDPPIHAWRTRFTPAMAPSRDPQIEYDEAGRAVAVTLTDRRRESWKWDDADRIVEWADVEGEVARYEYDELNRPVRMTADGRVFASAEYNEMGLLFRTVDARGKEARLAYDASGVLESLRDELGNLLRFINDRTGRPVEMRINGALTIRLAYDESGRLASVSDADGDATRYGYDANGRIVEVIHPDGGRTSYHYDDRGRLVAVAHPDGRETTFSVEGGGSGYVVKEATGIEELVQFDQLGQLRTAQMPGTPKYELTYSKEGRLLSAVGSDGQSRKFSYDARGRLVEETDAKGGDTRFTYDRDGRLAGYENGGESAAFAYESDGGLLVSRREDKQITELRYDAGGRLVEYRDDTGLRRKYVYEGTKLLGITGDGETLRYLYDANGRRVGVRHETNGKVASRQYRYDEAGRVSQITQEDGTTETFAYNPEGQLTQRTNGAGGVFRYTYHPGGRVASIAGPTGVERFDYDGRGRLVARDDPVEGTFRRVYSEDGHTITLVDPGGARTIMSIDDEGRPLAITDALGGTITRTYDEAGRLLTLTDQNGNTSSWVYDARGLPSEARWPGGKVARYRYDDRGLLAEIRLPDNRVITREYDALGRLVKLTTGNGPAWSYGYDAEGRLGTVQGPSGTASYVYDSLGRPLEFRDGGRASVRLTYDVAGRPETMETPDGRRVTYAYNAAGLLGSIADVTGHPIRYSYDDAGRVGAIAYPNGTRTTYRYLGGTRIQSIVTTDAAGRTLLAEAYEYDGGGNVSAITSRSELAASAPAGPAFQHSLGRSEFRYDALNRVVEAVFPDGLRERFKYDAAGNIVEHETETAAADGTRRREAVAYAYDADQALIAEGGRAAAPDANGNLCPERTGAACGAAYDPFGRLIAWRDQTYSYDGEGRPLEWRDGLGRGARLVHFEKRLVAEIGIGGAPSRFYIPGLQYGLWSALRVGDDDFYPIRSANGSLLAVTDKNGAIVEACQYRTFTNGSSWSADAAGARCEFAGGRQLGPGTWFGSRVLSAVGMRFMSPDAAGTDRDGNRYSYALANPLRFTDVAGTAGAPLHPMSATPEFQEPIIRRMKQIGAGTAPNPYRAQQAVDAARSGLPDPHGRAVAQKFVDHMKRGELEIRTYNFDINTDGSPSTTEAGSVQFARPRTAEVYTDPALRPHTDEPLRAMTGTAFHEGTHVDQIAEGRVRPDKVRRIHELEARLNQWRADPTMGTGRYVSPAEVVNDVANDYHHLPGSKLDQFPRQNMIHGGKVGIYDPVERPFADSIQKVKNLRVEQGINDLTRQGITPRPSTPSDKLSQALARSDALLKEAEVRDFFETPVMRRAATTHERVAEITMHAVDNAGTKLHAVFGKVGTAARRAASYIADSQLGRVVKYSAPVVGQVMAIKDSIDTAVWLGRSAGEAAADLYLAYKKQQAAILDPLDKLAKDISALSETDEKEKRKRKARRQELLSRASPDAIALRDRPPGAPRQTAAPTPEKSSSNNGSPTSQSGAPTGSGPSTPLGGQVKQPLPAQASSQPKVSPSGQPKQPIAPSPQAPDDRHPDPLKPSADAPPTSPPDAGRPANDNVGPAPAPERRDLGALCGSSYRESVQRMLANRISGLQANACFCHFWEKAGSKPGTLFNGRPIKEACADDAGFTGTASAAQTAAAEPGPKVPPSPTDENTGNAPGPPSCAGQGLTDGCPRVGYASPTDPDRASGPAAPNGSAQQPPEPPEPPKPQPETPKQASAPSPSNTSDDGLPPPSAPDFQRRQQELDDIRRREAEEWQRAREAAQKTAEDLAKEFDNQPSRKQPSSEPPAWKPDKIVPLPSSAASGADGLTITPKSASTPQPSSGGSGGLLGVLADAFLGSGNRIERGVTSKIR